MSKLRAKSLTLPDEVPFVPDTGRGKTEYISGKGKSFYGELRGKLNRAGIRTGRAKSSRFGRGTSRGVGGKYRQRVTVKARFQRHKGNSTAKGLKKHVSYLSREGVDRDGGPAKLFDQEGELSRDMTFEKVKDWEADRHHWRLVISPERGEDLDLNHFAHQFVEGMEQDLGTKLEWVGAAHYDTENPHIHLLIRGKTDVGDDLVIKRGYVSYGMRDLAEELATRSLGQRKEREILHEIQKGVTQERLGTIDRKLLYEVRGSKEGIIDLKSNHNLADRELRNLKIERLKFLRERGLARRVAPGKWQISDQMEKTLRDLSIRGDIIKTMHAKMKRGREDVFFQPGHHTDISGTVMHKGFVDPLVDKTFMLVEGNDGRNYYVALSKYSEKEGAESRVGDVVRVSSSGVKEKPIDQVIADIAKQGRGEVDRNAALAYMERREDIRKTASAEGYVKNLERRLSALERKKIVRRIDQERWEVPSDFQERVREQRPRYVKVTVEHRKDRRTKRQTGKSKMKGREV